MKMYEVFQNVSGNGYKFIGSATSMITAKKIIAEYSFKATLQELGDNEYYASDIETLYKVK